MANVLDEVMMEYIYSRINDTDSRANEVNAKICMNIELVKELRDVLRIMATPVLTPDLLPCI